MLATARPTRSGVEHTRTPAQAFRAPRLPRVRAAALQPPANLVQAAAKAFPPVFRRGLLLGACSVAAAAVWTSIRHLGGTGERSSLCVSRGRHRPPCCAAAAGRCHRRCCTALARSRAGLVAAALLPHDVLMQTSIESLAEKVAIDSNPHPFLPHPLAALAAHAPRGSLSPEHPGTVFAAMHSQDWLVRGRGGKATELLTAAAADARPALNGALLPALRLLPCRPCCCPPRRTGRPSEARWSSEKSRRQAEQNSDA